MSKKKHTTSTGALPHSAGFPGKNMTMVGKKSLRGVPVIIDIPYKDRIPESSDLTAEWFIYYHNDERPWEKDKVLLHAKTVWEVFESFSEKFPAVTADRIEYYGIYF